MKISETKELPRVAIYWDFENIHASLFEQHIGCYKTSKYSAQEQLLDVNSVMEFAKRQGRICVNRAYCNWSFFHRYADPLSAHGVQLVQMFARGAHAKNGADVQLCVDLAEDLLRLQLDVFIIVSGDSDYIGAALKIRSYGRKVLGVGVRETTNRHFQSVVDEFKFIDALSGGCEEAEPVEIPKAIPVSPSPKPASVAKEKSGRVGRELTLEEARSLLIESVKALLKERHTHEIEQVRIKPRMIKLSPAPFDERALGYSSFGQFLRASGGVIIVERQGQDAMVRLAENPKAGPPVATGLKWSECRGRQVVDEAVRAILMEHDVVLLHMLEQEIERLEPDFDVPKSTGFPTLAGYLDSLPEVELCVCGEDTYVMYPLYEVRQE